MANNIKWYLGFDCATKTFAFSLSRIDLEAYKADRLSLRSQLDNLRKTPDYKKIEELDVQTKSYIYIADGETIDLFPGRRDADVSTIERIRAVSRYIKARIIPSIVKFTDGEKIRVVVEFQMGHNARARAVSDAIITLFCEDEIILVGPSLKNKIYTCEEGKYCYFAEKYITSYSANKAHTKYNFSHLERLFGSGLVNMSDAKKDILPTALYKLSAIYNTGSRIV